VLGQPGQILQAGRIASNKDVLQVSLKMNWLSSQLSQPFKDNGMTMRALFMLLAHTRQAYAQP
jgi:hypothetical protein